MSTAMKEDGAVTGIRNKDLDFGPVNMSVDGMRTIPPPPLADGIVLPVTESKKV